MKLEDRCRNIELVLSDVDGVLTSGGIVFDNQGIESKEFSHPRWSGDPIVATGRIPIWDPHRSYVSHRAVAGRRIGNRYCPARIRGQVTRSETDHRPTASADGSSLLHRRRSDRSPGNSSRGGLAWPYPMQHRKSAQLQTGSRKQQVGAARCGS